MSVFSDIGAEIGRMVAEKNALYGNSVEKATACLATLYPDGISVEQMKNAIYVLRILDKLSRVASGKADTEDPVADIIGYGILWEAERKRNEV